MEAVLPTDLPVLLLPALPGLHLPVPTVLHELYL